MQESQEQLAEFNQKLYFFGSAECDQFDTQDEDIFEKKKPIQIPYFFTNKIYITKLTSGGLHTLALSNVGKLYSWGCNDEAALGRITEQNNQPGLVELEHPVDMIAAGDSHSIACNSLNKFVYLWGTYRTNARGKFSDTIKLPQRIGETNFSKHKKIDKILCGADHTLVLTDQKVYVWGDPETGVLGRKPNESSRKFEQALRVEGLRHKNVLDIYTGSNHSFLKKEKTINKVKTTVIVAWGLNNWGQLGCGYKSEDVILEEEIEEFRGKNVLNIVGGIHHSVALVQSEDLGQNKVYAFGRNDDGQLGLGEDYVKPDTEEEEDTEKIVDENEDENTRKQRELIQKLNNKFCESPVEIKNLENVQQIYAGGNYSYALCKENKVFTWGIPDNYVLANLKDDQTEYLPFGVNPKFFFEDQVGLLALGAQHVGFTIQKEVFEFDASVMNKIEVVKPVKVKKQKKNNKQSEENNEDKAELFKPLEEVDCDDVIEKDTLTNEENPKKRELENEQNEEEQSDLKKVKTDQF